MPDKRKPFEEFAEEDLHRSLDADTAPDTDDARPYTGRRGWATRAAEGGLDAFQIAEILGHSTLDQAQEYVQQTGAARMKLSAALSKYPQLTVIAGELGQDQDHEADRGADRDKRPPQRAAIHKGKRTS